MSSVENHVFNILLSPIFAIHHTENILSTLKSLAYSVLDLAGISEGLDISTVLRNSASLAQQSEKWGFTRYWLAEHHNMENIASSATAVLIAYIAGQTKTIRVGSGGVMLPNHTPLIVAEQFGTLASLYPNRIDLGLGRAPGTDQQTAVEIRGERIHAAQNFPREVLKLLEFLGDKKPDSKVRAIPGEGTKVPIWILGSSHESARLAATFGLPYAFASHFAPTYFLDAVQMYRTNFRPSIYLSKPYVISCVNVVAADSDEQAERLATTMKMAFAGIVTNNRKPLQMPVASMQGLWPEPVLMAVEEMLAYSFIGSKTTIKQKLEDFLAKTEIDELMACSHIYQHEARLHSYKLLSELINED